MTGVLKKIPFLLVVGFIVFYLFHDPQGLAAIAKSGTGAGWNLIQQLFSGVMTFLSSLTSH